MNPKKRRAKIRAVIRALKDGARLSHACKAAKLSRSIWYEWENKSPRLQRLRLAAEDVKDEEQIKQVEAAFITKLKSGKAHPIEYIFYFTNRDPTRWKDKRAIPTAVAIAQAGAIGVQSSGTNSGELAEIQSKQGALLERLAGYFPL